LRCPAWPRTRTRVTRSYRRKGEKTVLTFDHEFSCWGKMAGTHQISCGSIADAGFRGKKYCRPGRAQSHFAVLAPNNVIAFNYRRDAHSRATIFHALLYANNLA